MTFDAGNLLFNVDDISTAELPLKQETARLIIDVYNDLKYLAYNVGGHDLALGLEFLKELRNQAKFTFISANLIDSLSGQTVFEPYKIYNAEKKKFGVIGVTSIWNEKYRNLKIEDPVQTLKKYLPIVRAKADYIVILGALNANDENRLKDVDGKIDFVLLAGSYKYSRSLEIVGERAIARCGTIGKYIGIITAEINQPQKPLQDISNVNMQLEYSGNRLESFKLNAGQKNIEEYYADKPNQLKMIRDLENSQKDLNQKKSQIQNPLDFKLVGLNEEIEDNPAIRRKVDDFQKRMKARGFEIKSAH